MSPQAPPSTVDPAQYGETYRTDYLKIYTEYVASAERVSDRRNAANRFFSGTNAGLLGASSYFGKDAFEMLWIVAIAAVLMCLVWRGLIFSYKSLNSAKFAVILDMEKKLPLMPYANEWFHLQNAQRDTPHRALSDGEAIVPILFIVVNLCLFLSSFSFFILKFIP